MHPVGTCSFQERTYHRCHSQSQDKDSTHRKSIDLVLALARQLQPINSHYDIVSGTLMRYSIRYMNPAGGGTVQRAIDVLLKGA